MSQQAENTLDEISKRTGWNVDSQLALALDYINNQCSDDAWRDFLMQAAFEEEDNDPNAPPLMDTQDKCPKCGGENLAGEDNGDNEQFKVKCDDCHAQWREPGTVQCKFCGEDCRADHAHYHLGGWVGACCWDERLRSTE
jgi:hypothetical protein